MSRQLTDLYKRVPLTEITQPKGGLVNVYKDHWWMVTEANEALFFRGKTPQCNVDRSIVERLIVDGCRAEFVPVAFVRANASDYA